jgi:hypothetical protein
MILNKHNQFTDGCILSFTQLLSLNPNLGLAYWLCGEPNSISCVFDVHRRIRINKTNAEVILCDNWSHHTRIGCTRFRKAD